MKIRLTAEQTQRLKALVAAHPGELRNVLDALDAVIRMATAEVFEDHSALLEAHQQKRIKAWEEAKSDPARQKTPRRRRRAGHRITPQVSAQVRPALGAILGRTPRRRAVPAANDETPAPTKYVHKPAPGRAPGRAPGGNRTDDEWAAERRAELERTDADRKVAEKTEKKRLAAEKKAEKGGDAR